MKVAILGIDGYIGWPLAMRLMGRGHEVVGVDSLYTRKRVSEVNSDSVTPILSMEERIKKAEEGGLGKLKFYKGDVNEPDFLYNVVRETKPDAFVHLAEQRSAPYSMIGLKQARETLMQNIGGTLNLVYAMKDIVPKAHLLKLGTMGEYGTPNIDIPEGFFKIDYNGRQDVLPFPKFAGSWYHWSKVHDTNNLMFANKVWKLKITDVMQGVVYGTETREIKKHGLYTRFDIDEVWGTALNRFCTQAVLGYPLSAYGKGNQRRGFLSLEDSISCLTLGIEKEPEEGEYRVYNQFDEHYSINELTEIVSKRAKELFHNEVEIKHYPNPRVEKEEHYYNPEHSKLKELGYKPSRSLPEDIDTILRDVNRFREKALELKKVIEPKTVWEKSKGLAAN
ncbi:MAG: GDP-mannose 4,6-dehydratase [Candidatus Thermoplasmatota archaeon]|nr:GDP-mannose 4,6-dehydratase [Candidatus Thermoplasmatota archaeon]MCL5889309.1 GDP-mannose 4,6-dehydratase [Candidatus Thermoplasmatota archaeon]